MSGPSALYNRVLETTSTTGTGTLTLSGALNASCQSFNLVGDGNTCFYRITDNLTYFECGIGTFTLSGRTLSRDTILDSSNSGNAAAIPSGTNYVELVDPASVRQRTLFVGTASVTVSATGDTTLMPSGKGSATIPAKWFQVGKTIRFKARGIISTGLTPGNATITLKLGGTGVVNTGAFALVASLTNLAWDVEVELTCRTTGVSGTLFVQGMFTYEVAAVGADVAGMVNTTTNTVDTTIAEAVDFSVNFGSTGNSISLTNCSIESLN